MDNKTKIIMRISNNVLGICDNRDEFPRGDLQGAIEAQVMIAYHEGRADGLDYAIKKVKKMK